MVVMRRLPGRLADLLVLLVGLGLLAWMGQWGILQATWEHGPSSVCAEVSGACWSIIAEKWQLILFGRFPQDELWRPVLATALLLGAAGFSGMGRLSGTSLILVWVATPIMFIALMHGGLLGLAPVSSEIWGGLPLTMMLAIFGIVFAFPLGIILAIARQSRLPLISWLATGYIELFRGIPLITVLFLASFVLPLVLPPGTKTDALVRVQVCIVLFTASYLAEIVRGGLQSIPQGQVEAASVLGMSDCQAYRFIILPQALARVIPATVNTFIELFKDTSLVAIVSLSDLLLTTRLAISEPGWRMHFVEAYLFIAFIYFLFCFILSRWSRRLEVRYATH